MLGKLCYSPTSNSNHPTHVLLDANTANCGSQRRSACIRPTLSSTLYSQCLGSRARCWPTADTPSPTIVRHVRRKSKGWHPWPVGELPGGLQWLYTALDCSSADLTQGTNVSHLPSYRTTFK